MISRNMFALLAVGSMMGCLKPKKQGDKGTLPPPTPVPAGENVGTADTGNKAPLPGTPGTTPETATVPEGPEIALAYPVPDPDLGEFLADGEIEAAAEIANVIDGQIRAKYPMGSGKRALRDAHPKAHGCLKAEFKGDPDIKSEYDHVVFTKGNSFEAIVRFSNTSKPYDPDIKGDGRGMAFKLLNVPGKKLLENETQAFSQDFIMISHPVFFISDAKDYVDFIKNFENSDLASQLATAKSLGPLGMKIALDFTRLQISSPIQIQYWSNVPYQLGVGPNKKAVKYTARPCAINGKDSVPT